MRRWLWFFVILLWPISASAQNTVGTFKMLVDVVDARTIADNGGGTAATLTLTPRGSFVTITCNDADGCAITLGETGVRPGQQLRLFNLSANAVTLADSAGVQELQSSVSLAQWASLSCEYLTDRWSCGGSGGGSGTVTTTGSPASGNLAFFSGASSITSGNLSGDVTTSGTGAATIANDAVSNAKLRNSGALSVIGRSANSSGDPADISASAASDAVLRESGSVLGFGTIATGGLANNAVTYAKMQQVSAATRLLCRGSAAGAGNVEECTLGSGLSMSGTQVVGSGGGGGGGGSSVYPTRAEGRLTTESGVPISTSDRTAQSTLYWTPCVSYMAGTCLSVTTGVITLWNGTDAVDFATTQLSKTLTGLTSGKNYDVFIDYNGGAPQIVLSAAWSTDTARADALSSQYDSTRQVTLLIKSGTPAYRWVGMIRTTGTTTTEDSLANRLVWNVNNQALRKMKGATETANSWNYTTATFRQANANTANQLAYVSGDAASVVEAHVRGMNFNASDIGATLGIGVDSTTVNSADTYGNNPGKSQATPTDAFYAGQPGLGYHFLAWLEYSDATGTTTWYGDAGNATIYQMGITGTIWN